MRDESNAEVTLVSGMTVTDSEGERFNLGNVDAFTAGSVDFGE